LQPRHIKSPNTVEQRPMHGVFIVCLDMVDSAVRV